MDLAKTTAPDLYRDMRNNAILCTDITRYVAYKTARQQAQSIGALNSEISELRELLQKALIKTDK